MRFSIIAACSKNRVIGNKGKIPWNLKADRLHFKEITSGHTVIFGRKTFEEIDHALPDRFNIIVSSTKNFCAENMMTVQSLKEAVASAKIVNTMAFLQNDEFNSPEVCVFFCGGEKIYSEALEFADDIFLTEIQENFEGDRYFPVINPEIFNKDSESSLFEENGIHYKYFHFSRKN